MPLWPSDISRFLVSSLVMSVQLQKLLPSTVLGCQVDDVSRHVCGHENCKLCKLMCDAASVFHVNRSLDDTCVCVILMFISKQLMTFWFLRKVPTALILAFWEIRRVKISDHHTSVNTTPSMQVPSTWQLPLMLNSLDYHMETKARCSAAPAFSVKYDWLDVLLSISECPKCSIGCIYLNYLRFRHI